MTMIDLTRFCGADDPREYMHAPFQEGGNTFATNGHIAIQLDGVADPSTPEVSNFLKGRIQKMLAQIAANQVELLIELPPAKPCKYCQGCGSINARSCGDCAGTGSFEHGEHTYDCKACNADGEIHTPTTRNDPEAEVCMACDGHGTASAFIDTLALGIKYRFQERYLRLISELPGSRLYATADNSGPVRFDFDGGRGVLMPCRI
jgi:hypothetical protein